MWLLHNPIHHQDEDSSFTTPQFNLLHSRQEAAMALLSATALTPTKTQIPTPPPLSFPSKTPKLRPTLFRRRNVLSATTTTTENILLTNAPPDLPPWQEFASRVSGEWDGFGADFTSDGLPVELPESVVPEAFREWEVKVFDWQTQCPTLADETSALTSPPMLRYQVIKLLPTVGCEADAATRHSVEERDVSRALGFGFERSGCYVAVWPVKGRVMEVEHCLVDPRDREVRVRVVQVVRVGEGGMRLEGIKAFSEQWYGPFRNGEQLGGCAIRESGFATTGAVKEEDVVGVWQGRSVMVASFGGEDKIQELVSDSPQKSIRDKVGLVALPKQLWSSFKEKDGETCGEVGWLFDHGCAMVSRCAFRQDGSLKEMTVGRETAISEGI